MERSRTRDAGIPFLNAANAERRDERSLRSLIKGLEWTSGSALVLLGLLVEGHNADFVAFRLALMGVCAVAAAIYFVMHVRPLLSSRAYEIVDHVQEVVAVLTIALLVYLTGGASSPYIGFFFYPVLYTGFFLRGRMVVWLTALASFAAALPAVYDAGAADAHFGSRLVVFVAAFAILATVMFLHKKQLHTAELAARTRAFTDPLTELLNRRGYYERAKKSIQEHSQAQARGAGKPATSVALLVDIDEFKVFNTRLGHAGGDAVLRRVAAALKASSGPSSIVARVGGDEFAIFVPDADTAGAIKLASDCIEAIAADSDLTGSDAQITASIGIAVFPDDGHSIDDLMRVADGAMYRAKSTGKGHIARSNGQPIAALEKRPVALLLDQAAVRHSSSSTPLLPAIAAPAKTKASSRSPHKRSRLGGRPDECLIAVAAWLGSCSLLGLSMLVPDHAPINTRPILAIVALIVSLAAFAFFGWRQLGSFFYTTANTISSLVIGVAMYLTGGATSPLLPFLFFSVAFAATFFTTRSAIVRIAFSTLMFATPFAYVSATIRAEYVVSFAVMATCSIITAISVIYSKGRMAAARDASHQLSLLDPLTGLANRRALHERFDSELELAAPGYAELALCVVDLDNFKNVNTQRGHSGGDEFLRAFARTLEGIVRPSDCVARIGGDEFALLIPLERVANVNAIARRCVSAARAMTSEGDWAECRVSASVGFALCPVDGRDLETLIRAADDALMTVKATGKNAASGARPEHHGRTR